MHLPEIRRSVVHRETAQECFRSLLTLPGFSERFSTNPFKHEVPVDSAGEGHASWQQRLPCLTVNIERIGFLSEISRNIKVKPSVHLPADPQKGSAVAALWMERWILLMCCQ